MGLKIPPLPDDYGPGADCLFCWPAGKTPNYVFIRFWDIVTCPGGSDPPNGRTFICPQVPGTSCMFTGDLNFAGDLWRAYWHSSFFQRAQRWSELQLNNITTGELVHYYERKDQCAVDFSNSSNTCPPNPGTGGHAHVQVFVPAIIIGMSSEYHFVTQPNPLYEMQDVGMDHELIHLACRYDKTNVLIYLDKEDYDF